MDTEDIMIIDGVKVKKLRKELSYLRENGQVHRRAYHLYIPETAASPMPCIFYVHYVLPVEAAEFADYMRRGWAVATPEMYLDMSREWMDDDLFFNNAVLYDLRKEPEIAWDRIMLTGYSAGGYMTMMLSILHTGICGCVSLSGVTNNYFMALGYHRSGLEINEKAFVAFPEKVRRTQDDAYIKEHIPQWRIFSTTRDFMLFDGKNTEEKYIERSPVTHWQALNNPFVFSHFTSDNIVPIDMLTSKYTYEEMGETMPKGIRFKLSDCALPGSVSKPLDERLPEEDVFRCFRSAPPDKSNETMYLKFDPEKRFNINVFDEGRMENIGGHFKNLSIGRQHFLEFADYCMERTAAVTSWLTPDKIVLLAEVYRGESILMPAAACDLPGVYGTLTQIRSDIIEELRRYAEMRDDIGEAFVKAKEMKPDYRDTIETMRKSVES